MAARTLDRFFASSWHMVSGGIGGPHRPDPGLKQRWVAWHGLRRFALDRCLVSARLLVSAAIYFTDPWKTVKYPAVELPLNFFLSVIGETTRRKSNNSHADEVCRNHSLLSPFPFSLRSLS